MLDVLNDFQNNVLYVVIVILIILLVIFTIMMYYINKHKNKDDTPFPKQQQICPDYWEDHSTNADGSKCVNTKSLGTSRNKTMNFSTSIWKGSQGLCNKALWAKNCNLSWDGITNNTRQKCKTSTGLIEREYSIIPTTDYAGQYDINNGIINGDNNDCENACDSVGCNAFVYDNKSKTCTLKNIKDKNTVVPSYDPHKSLNVVGTGFKSYKDANNICSSENKDNTCVIKEGFTVENKSNLLKASKCNVKLLDDGNLVIYDISGKPLWASNTYNKGKGPYSMKMQDNGNLVIYDSNNEQIWQTGTTEKGDGPYNAILDDTCTLNIKDSNNNILWKANESTSEKQKPGTCSAGINYGLCENKISSSTIDLVMQDDGNLVIYDKKDGSVKWSTGTNGKGTPPYRLMMQTDGNLIVYDNNNTVLWATSTNGQGGNMLTLTDDKNVIMTSPSNKKIWSSRVDRNYSVLENTNYDSQGDMKNMVGSITECQNECDYANGCNAFFYDNNGNRCYMKSVKKEEAFPKFVKNGSMYVVGTGFKSYKDLERSYNIIQNTDYGGGQGDIKNMDGTKEDCQHECDATKGCNGFFLLDTNNSCLLKGVNKDTAVPNYNSSGSMFVSEQGFKSYKDKTPYWQVVENKNTQFNDEGGGNTIFLDRHNVDCSNNGINRFILTRDGKGNFRYDYSCSAPYIDGMNMTDNEVKSATFNSTGLNDQGGGNSIFLDRHQVDCGEDGAITQFHLDSMGTNNKYQYNYRCIKMNKPMTSRMVTTPANDDGGGNSIYLDRHNVACADDEVMNYFTLYRPSDNQIAYSYRCSK